MTFEYFETDQIKFAVRLWRAVKKSGGAEFDVLKFTQNWMYAETVLVNAVTSDDETVSAIAIEVAQLRTQFMDQEPARAKKLGAQIGGQNEKGEGARTSAEPQKEAEKDTPAPSQYIKTLR